MTLWRVLLDSGSDGDTFFQPRSKNKAKTIPYTKRLLPQIWQTSMGQFRTDKVGDFALTLPEYSGNVRAKSTTFSVLNCSIEVCRICDSNLFVYGIDLALFFDLG